MLVPLGPKPWVRDQVSVDMLGWERMLVGGPRGAEYGEECYKGDSGCDRQDAQHQAILTMSPS